MDVRDACESLRKNKEDRGEALLRIVEAIVNEGYEVILPKVGRWIPHDKFEYECSECGYTFIADDTDSILSTSQHDRMDMYNCIGILLKAV